MLSLRNNRKPDQADDRSIVDPVDLGPLIVDVDEHIAPSGSRASVLGALTLPIGGHTRFVTYIAYS